ncbi:hypothetical protein NP493_924g02009 [Ridgeia piscesae]|uniref:Uncharacterized protein n=1 Tax=Ridgeia piscesae TaxID=27915 RepID=A0AAD9NK07_RIDPI|nr:hypothetical protein NP493_924g02009 [Ridgeia piscesae]
MVAPASCTVPTGKVVHMMQSKDGEQIYKMVTFEELLEPPHGFMPCPICGDHVSGYHYGIYSCESCKGFFKRTVQNKKVFVCHRQADCNINVTNRKKCPACRFKRCLVKGMKLEAIRGDRTRGGRSSYDGCTPNRRNVKQQRRKSDLPMEVITTTRQPAVVSQPPAAPSPGQMAPPGTHVVTILTVDNSGTVVDVEQTARLESITAHVPPQTPQLLEDLMTVESLMHDNDEEEDCCKGKLSESDTNLFASLLHIADHCLYKIVRWARNLPHFGNVSTDDQILLLQNCWAELLCLCTSWHSVRGQDELRLSHDKVLSMKRAQATGMADIIQRLLDFTEHLRRLEVDCYEYVALKVLMLLSPDVKNLQDESLVRQHQDHVTEALMIYTNTHYPQKPNKFCEMLVRLTELSRTCVLGKELLNQRHSSGEISPHSLLSELLKGDIVVQ